MIINGWFLAILIIGVLNIGINMAKHGEEKNEKYNFFGSLFGFALQVALVYMAIKTGL